MKCEARSFMNCKTDNYNSHTKKIAENFRKLKYIFRKIHVIASVLWFMNRFTTNFHPNIYENAQNAHTVNVRNALN